MRMKTTEVVDWARTAEQWATSTAHSELNNEKRVTAVTTKKVGKKTK